MNTAQQNESRAWLLGYLPKGTVVYVIARSVAKSGMSRRLSFLILVRYGEPRYLDYHIGIVLGLKQVERPDGLLVRGCGMDMGFHVVSKLSHKLHGNDLHLVHRWL